MFRGLNKVMVIGWLDSPVELRVTPGGRPVASFKTATMRSWATADGQQHQETDIFSVIVWGDLAEFCERRLKKDQKLYLEGRLQNRQWVDKSGQNRSQIEIVASEIIPLGS